MFRENIVRFEWILECFEVRLSVWEEGCQGYERECREEMWEEYIRFQMRFIGLFWLRMDRVQVVIDVFDGVLCEDLVGFSRIQ